MFLLSPSERELPALLEGITSSLPESYGADVLTGTPRGLIGWQRKTMPDDLLASLEDGRLSKEIELLKSLPFAVLIVEGRPDYTGDGHLMSSYRSKYTRQQLRNILRSCWYTHGIRIEETADLQDTASAIKELTEWLSKDTHRSLLVRPKASARGPWGQADRRSWARFLLQSFPFIGPERAEIIYDTLGIPLQWTVSKEELDDIPGIGPIIAKAMWESLTP